MTTHLLYPKRLRSVRKLSCFCFGGGLAIMVESCSSYPGQSAETFSVSSLRISGKCSPRTGQSRKSSRVRDDIVRNEKVWHLNDTEFAQQVEFLHIETLATKFYRMLLVRVCRAEMQNHYDRPILLLEIDSYRLSKIVSTSCTCITSSNKGTNCFLQTYSAVLHALKYAVEVENILEWPNLCTSRKQQWGTGRCATGTKDLHQIVRIFMLITKSAQTTISGRPT